VTVSYPAIPPPDTTPEGLHASVAALKNAVEMLTSQTGGSTGLGAASHSSLSAIQAQLNRVQTSVTTKVLAAHMSANQANNNAWAVAKIDTIDLDTQGAFNTTTFKYTPNVAGIYLFLVNANANQSTGSGGAAINLNGNIPASTGTIEGWIVCAGISAVSLCVAIAMNGTTDFVQVSLFGSTANAFSATNPTLTAFRLPS
jgi:hypothetical protein